jgi:NADH-quinone oxidoreductase subunit K
MIGEIPLYYYLILSFALFSVGMLGLMIRRNAIVMLMSMELMLNGANLVFAAYARFRGDEAGQVMAFFVMALAAAEAAVGLALVIAVYRHFKTLHVDEMNTLRG